MRVLRTDANMQAIIQHHSSSSIALKLIESQKKSVSERFHYFLISFLDEAYGINESQLNPDLLCFVNAQAKIYTYQGISEVNNICGAVQLAPGRTGKKNGNPITKTVTPEGGKSLFMEKCHLLYDSCAFTDVLTGSRISPESALERQLTTLQKIPTPKETWLVSYDRLIDEKYVNGERVKERWTVQEGCLAVSQTVEAAKYLDSQRYRLDGYRLVQSCQGVDDNQYLQCVDKVLNYCQPNDVIGLGGWCILGKQKRWLPTFWETINKVIPVIAQVGIKHVHIFGCTWYKPMQGFKNPPLPTLLWLCDQYGISLSTDGRSPISNALWKSGWKAAGATFPYWRHNLAWVKAEMATLRDSRYYRSPPFSVQQMKLI